MEEVLHGVGNTDIYLDDNGAFSMTWGAPYLIIRQIAPSIESQWFHCQSAQMQMGHPKNWLAWILADTHWFKTVA